MNQNLKKLNQCIRFEKKKSFKLSFVNFKKILTYKFGACISLMQRGEFLVCFMLHYNILLSVLQKFCLSPDLLNVDESDNGIICIFLVLEPDL